MQIQKRISYDSSNGNESLPSFVPETALVSWLNANAFFTPQYKTPSESFCADFWESTTESSSFMGDPNAPSVLTLSEFDALTEYENKIYTVIDYGVFHGATPLRFFDSVFGADDIHVKTSGDDSSGDGSSDNAFLTISRAVKENIDDATEHSIWVHGGTYAQDSFINSSGNTSSGQSRLRLIDINFAGGVEIKAVANEKVILTNASGAASGLIELEGACGGLTFRGFTFQVSADSSYYYVAATIANNIRFIDCVMLGCTSTGLWVWSGGVSNNFSLLRNRVECSGYNITKNLLGFYCVGNYITGATHAFRFYATNSGDVFFNNNAVISTEGFIQESAFSLGVNFAAKFNQINAGTDGIKLIGGTAGNETSIDISANRVMSGRRGIVLGDFISGGTISKNIIVAGSSGHSTSTGLGVPNDGGGGSGKVENILVEYNRVESKGGHAFLISSNGKNITVRGNVTTAANGGDHGAVIKGENHTVTFNKLSSGSASALYLKGVQDSTFEYNRIVCDGATAPLFGGIAATLGNGAQSGIAPENILLRGNRISSSNAPVFLLDSSDIGSNLVIDENLYTISGTGSLGSVRGSLPADLGELKQAWGGYSNDNDSNSIVQ